MGQIRRAAQPPVSESVSARVDLAIAPVVSELRSLSVFQSIVQGAIEKETYTNLLQMLLTMHRSLERALPAAIHLKGFDSPEFRREESLTRDLRMLSGHLPVRGHEVLDQFESRVRIWARRPCLSLIGALYALERERKDSLKLVLPLANALRIKVASRSGLDYFMDGADHAARRFHKLRSWIDVHIRQAERSKDVVEGGVETMRTLAAIHKQVGESGKSS